MQERSLVSLREGQRRLELRKFGPYPLPDKEKEMQGLRFEQGVRAVSRPSKAVPRAESHPECGKPKKKKATRQRGSKAPKKANE